MKKQNLLYILSLIISCCLFSCSEKRKQCTTPKEQFLMELTSEDTAQVLRLSQSCMDTLKNGNIDEALKMMYVMQNGKVIPLPDEKESQLRKNFNYFPVINYKLEYYSFSDTDNNDVKFQIKFCEQINPNDKAPNTIGFMFNPIKINGVWYLTIKESDQGCNVQSR